MRTRSLPSCLLMVLCVALTAGCRKKAEKPPKQQPIEVTPPATSVAPVQSAETTQPKAPGRPFPKIIRISPETITLNNGHLPGGVLTVDYEIDNPEGVEKAVAELYSPGFNQRVRVASESEDSDWSGLTPPPQVQVPVQASGSVNLSLDAPDFDLSKARQQYLEVKLKVKGPGVAYEAIKRLPYSK